MKKILIMIVLFFAISCATIQNKRIKQYPNLTPDTIQNTCSADNRWSLQVLGTSTIVLRYSNCLGIDKMLVMITSTDQYTSKIRQNSCRLLKLHYLDFLKNTQKDRLWSAKKIKEFIIPVDTEREEPEKWVVIYKIGSKPLKCSGDTCKIND